MTSGRSNSPARETRRRPTPVNAFLASLLAFALLACSTPSHEVSGANSAGSRAAATLHRTTAKTATLGYRAIGLASWYGGKFHGRRTASGERFNMRSMTAAHRTLPFGTLVRVTNLGNNRSVVVRINDRGPFVKRRIIDVSRKAAIRLGLLKTGVARVRVEVVKRPKT